MRFAKDKFSKTYFSILPLKFLQTEPSVAWACGYTSWTKCYKTFYGRNLQIFVIS
jgi:hypothetical protein